MKKQLTAAFVLAIAFSPLALGACSGGDKGSSGGDAIAPGRAGAGGTSSPVAGTRGQSAGSGGSVSTGGTSGAGGGSDDAAAGASGSDATGASAQDAPTDAPVPATDAAPSGPTPAAGLPAWYPAGAIPPNERFGRARVGTCKAPCDTKTMKPNTACCVGGTVSWIVSGNGPGFLPPAPPDGRNGGELRYNKIAAPADGMYDVTWWYYCGNNDNFGDENCGGQTELVVGKQGCRPHQIIVNGTEMPGTYHFPCFGGDWGIIRAATTQLPLKAGADNSIHVYSHTPRDAADMNALQISAIGQGSLPLIKSNPDPIGGKL